ncbi:hypothetical protein PUND_a1741 [Pseudoalteromonas undina]|uniref:Uncharacterized protein n=1 Tax=Pseudoalteromonas undina TaxID=43660 RepID=A0ABN0ND01_9GAMM|nr:hypothetical protein [Pseudoalteromonas undina]KAF7765985.1 hypothetical protein PUND_a1741 [Pseudoalteromonas undina]
MNQLEGFGLGPLAKTKLNGGRLSNIPAYKFLHKEDLRYWLEDKTIKIDSLLSFSGQENTGGVGDPLEMEIKGISAFVENVNDPITSLIVNNLRSLGVADLKCGNRITIENFTTRRANRFIYCMSSSINENLYKKWHEVEGYDSIIKIKDIAAFVKAIQFADYYDQRLLGGRAIFDWVEYVDMPPDLSVVDLTEYKFIKDKNSFEWQTELRFSWPNGPQENNLPYYLHIPDLCDHLEVIDIPNSWKNNNNA